MEPEIVGCLLELAPAVTDVESHLHPVESCPICDSCALNERGLVPTIHPRSALRTRLMECRTCRHWFITPVPSQETLVSLYAANSEYVVGREWKGMKKRLSVPERYVIDEELRATRRGRNYLEIGVGAGLLFDYFRGFGYECVGVDPGPWARSRPGLVPDVTHLEGSDYHVVVLADVLEHLRDPRGMVRFLSQRMESGTLYACFPNNESLRAGVARSRWRMVRPFGHLHFFSRRSLTLMFASAGFQLKDLRKTDLVDFHWRSFLWPPFQGLQRIFMLPTQHLWGDQWIVRAQRC